MLSSHSTSITLGTLERHSQQPHWFQVSNLTTLGDGEPKKETVLPWRFSSFEGGWGCRGSLVHRIKRLALATRNIPGVQLWELKKAMHSFRMFPGSHQCKNHGILSWLPGTHVGTGTQIVSSRHDLARQPTGTNIWKKPWALSNTPLLIL